MKILPEKPNGFAFPVIILIVCVLAAVAGGGYYFLNNRTRVVKTENGTTVTYDQKGNEVKVSTKEGTLVINQEGGVKLPPDFPKDYPIYPKTKITSAMVSDDATLYTAGYTLESKDSTKVIAEWYRKEGPRLGWKIIGEDAIGSIVSITFTKNDLTGALTVIDSENGYTTISFSGGKMTNGSQPIKSQDSGDEDW